MISVLSIILKTAMGLCGFGWLIWAIARCFSTETEESDTRDKAGAERTTRPRRRISKGVFRRRPVIAILAICTIGGALLSVIADVLWLPFYEPRLSIKIPSSFVDPSVPQPVKFTVENIQWLPARSADFTCFIVAAALVAGHTRIDMKDTSIGTYALSDLEQLQPIDVTCPKLETGALSTDADIEFLISYQARFRWSRQTTCARFAIKETVANLLEWFQKPTPHCDDLLNCLKYNYQRQNPSGLVERDCTIFSPDRK